MFRYNLLIGDNDVTNSITTGEAFIRYLFFVLNVSNFKLMKNIIFRTSAFDANFCSTKCRKFSGEILCNFSYECNLISTYLLIFIKICVYYVKYLVLEIFF